MRLSWGVIGWLALVLLTTCVASHPGEHQAGTVRPTVNRLLNRGDIQVAEALLLWALQRHDPVKRETALTSALGKTLRQKPPTDLEQWHLHQFIEVAAERDLISADTASQARLAKDFRNLIHPGRA